MMADFSWFQSQAGDGRFLCMICFENKSIVNDAYEDENGDKWDICTSCATAEDTHV